MEKYNNSEKNLKDKYKIKKQLDYEEICKKKYLLNSDKILHEKILIDHDGFDKYGPESNLYNYYIIIERNNEILYQNFYREDWYSECEWYYECFSKIPFTKKITEDIYKKIQINDKNIKMLLKE